MTPENRIQEHVGKLLSTPAGQVVVPEREAEVLFLFRGLGFVEDAANLRALADHVASALLDGAGPSRRRAALLGRTLLTDLDGTAQAEVVAGFADPLKVALREEQDPQVLDALPALIGAWVRVSVLQDRWPIVGSLLEEALEPRLRKGGLPTGFEDQVRTSLRGIGDAEKARILAMLQAAPSVLVKAIRPAVLAVGASAVAEVEGRMFTSVRPDEARRAATILGKFDPARAEALAGELPAAGGSKRGKRLLEVMDALKPGNVATVLTACLDHADPGVRAEAASALARLGRAYALAVARSVIASAPEGPAALECLRLARAMELRELATELVKLATSTKRPEIFDAGVRALCAFPVPTALPALKLAIGRPPGLDAEPARRLRSLAAGALAKIDTPEARELAGKLAKELADELARRPGR